MLIKRRKRSVPSLNTTSTADISFMLLTFFLVTSSMDVDKELVRQLPPLDKEDEADEARAGSKGNTLSLRITAQNEVMLNAKPVAVEDIRRRIVDFVRMRGAQTGRGSRRVSAEMPGAAVSSESARTKARTWL